MALNMQPHTMGVAEDLIEIGGPLLKVQEAQAVGEAFQSSVVIDALVHQITVSNP